MGVTRKDIENQQKSRVGEEIVDKYGCVIKIIEYNAYNDILVEFQDEYKYQTKARYDVFLDRRIKNVYRKNHFGVAYTGESSATDEFRNTKQSYTVWNDMLRRCYSEKSLKKRPTYIGCSVSEDWLCYTVFEKWFNNNYYKVENETMNLDKDILIKGNKVYSDKTCVFVPDRINKLFIKSNAKRGINPIGVCFNTSKNKFEVMCGRKNCGVFNDNISAFYAYKKEKERQIKQVADEYKDKIPSKLYDAMYKYEVEITD